MKNSPSRSKLIIGLIMVITIIGNAFYELSAIDAPLQNIIIALTVRDTILIISTIITLVYWNRISKSASWLAFGLSIFELLWMMFLRAPIFMFYFSLIFIVLTLIALLVDIRASRQQK